MSALEKRGRAPHHQIYVGVREGRVVRLKVCPVCEEEGICSQDSDESDFWVARREGSWQSYCKGCSRRVTREYALARRDALNERRRERARENRESRNELRRLDRALRRDEEGLPLRVPALTVVDGTSPRVEAEPFRLWLRAHGAETGREGPEAIANALDVVPKTLWRVLEGGQKYVSLDVVDRCILNSHVVVMEGREILRLEDLYPLEAS